MKELPNHNLFYLLSERDSAGNEGTVDSTSISKLNIPCKSSKAATAWRKQRDTLLLEYLQLFLNEPVERKKCLLLVSSVSEVNSTLTLLSQSSLPASGIGCSPETISKLQSLFATEDLSSASILVLSAPIALLGLVHGFIQLEAFSSLVFADARGANQAHPFCLLMNHFYTPSQASKARILGFSAFPEASKVFNPEDVFSRRDWLRQLRHYNRTFQSSVRVLDDHDESGLLSEFLYDFGKCDACFGSLSILETRIIDNELDEFDALFVDDLNASIPDTMHGTLLIKHQQNIPSLLRFLERAHSAGIERVIHLSHDASFAGRLSLAALLKSLRSPSQADLTLLQRIAHDAECILSPQLHLQDCLRMDSPSHQAQTPATASKAIPLQNFSFDHESALRVPSTGALASLESAVGILVRACTLIAPAFRADAALKETIKLKSFRAFPCHEQKKLSTSPGFIALLSLPQLMEEAIKSHVLTSATASAFDPKFTGWLQGSLQLTRLEAQGIVALRAIKLLHAAGILDDHLMLSVKYCECSDAAVGMDEGLEADTVEAIDQEDDDDNDEDDADHLKEVCFDEIIPDALLKSALKDRLYIYALEYDLQGLDDSDDPFTLTPDSRVLHFSSLHSSGLNMFCSRASPFTWSLLLPTPLPQGFLPVEVPLGSDHMFCTKLRLIGELPVDSAQYRHLLHLQPILFNLFNMRPLTAPKVGEKVPLQSEAVIVPENKCPFYLIAPLKHLSTDPSASHLLSVEDLPRLHRLFQEFIQSFQAAPLEGAQLAPGTCTLTPHWTIDWELCQALKRTDESVSERNFLPYLTALTAFPVSPEDRVQLEAGAQPLDFPTFALSRLLLHSPHTHTLYRPLRLRPDYSAQSDFSSATVPEARTFAQYAQLRYHLPPPADLTAPLLQVKRIEHWADLAVWGSSDAASKHRKKKTSSQHSQQQPSLLIPDHANVLPLPYAAVRMAMLLPRVTAEVERQLRIAQFFLASPQLRTLRTHPTHSTAVPALTASSAALSYSYEQLEVLGDSLLKHLSSLDVLSGSRVAGWTEGKLTAQRMERLSNARLARAGAEVGVFKYATFTPFLARLWTASSGLLIELLSEGELDKMELDQMNDYYSTLARSRCCTIFDPADRWIALAALQGKHSQRTLPLLLSLSHNRLHLPSPTDRSQTRAEQRGRAAVLYRHGQAIPPKKIADVMEALIGAYYQDCGVAGAVGFLSAVGVIRGAVVEGALLRDALRSEFSAWSMSDGASDGKESVIEKWKRRKVTPLNSLLVSELERGVSVGVDGTSGSASSTALTSTARPSTHPSNTHTATHPSIAHHQLPFQSQSIDNVQPHLPSPAVFPYSEIESLLRYCFSNPALLLQAFTHCTGADGVVVRGDNEVLEWIGDAALDWVMCRYFWYGLRDRDSGDRDGRDGEMEVDLSGTNETSESTDPSTDLSTSTDPSTPPTDTTILKVLVHSTHLPEFSRPHPISGPLPLSPDDLTRARQSITNNDALARIAVHFGLQRWLRIDSPHLQREIEKFSRECASGGVDDSESAEVDKEGKLDESSSCNFINVFM